MTTTIRPTYHDSFLSLPCAHTGIGARSGMAGDPVSCIIQTMPSNANHRYFERFRLFPFVHFYVHILR
jgi:hypothetical protein